MSEETTGAAETTTAEVVAAPAEQAAPAPELSTEQQLEQEFGQVEPPATEEVVSEGDKPKDGKEEAPEPKNPTQERFDELTAARREAERKAEESARDAEYWRAKAQDKEAPAVKQEVDKSDQEPTPDDYEFGEADSRFIRDTAIFHAKAEARAERDRERVRDELAGLDRKWEERSVPAREKYPDFDKVVNEGADKVAWPCSQIVALGIRESEVGPDVAYHLATNVEEAKRIYNMHPLQQAREFGRLEGRFLDAAVAAPVKENNTVTKASPPPTHTARGVGGKFSVQADTEDFGAFDKAYGNAKS